MVILSLLLKFNMFQIYGFNHMVATITWSSLVKMLITCPLSRTINLEILGVNPRTHYLLLTMILRNSEILQNLRTVDTIIKFYLFFLGFWVLCVIILQMYLHANILISATWINVKTTTFIASFTLRRDFRIYLLFT